MKKITLILALLVCTVAINAEQHLTFKGIPITGSISQFKSKMEKVGCKFLKQANERMYGFVGSYDNYSECLIIVDLNKKQVVSSVSIYLPSLTEWDKLHFEYLWYKIKFTEKYGKPSWIGENTKENFYELSDKQRLTSIKEEESEFWSRFDVGSLGSIEVTIDYKGSVVITHTDAINGKITADDLFGY